MPDLKTIEEAGDLKGKKVLLRLDLNVPILDGEVENDFRIKRSIPILRYLKAGGAKTLVVSHIWGDELQTLKPVHKEISRSFKIGFLEDIDKESVEKASAGMKDGETVLLENIRKDPREKANDDRFSRELAGFADIYVNDAFATSHREHASIVGVPKYLESYMGPLFKEELFNLSKVIEPERPFLFLLGGAKFDTKIPLIEKYLDKADRVFAAGALSNELFRQKGLNIGRSVVWEKPEDFTHILDNSKLMLPADVTVRNEKGVFVKKPEEVEDNDQILDIGVKTIIELRKLIKEARFILWNGPVGDYEKGFRDGSLDLARAITESTADSIVGGGDTFAVISKLNLHEKFSFVSTAGGALLEFLYSQTLPGIEAIREAQSRDS